MYSVTGKPSAGIPVLLMSLACLYFQCKPVNTADKALLEHDQELINKIAFGSCGSQDLPQPVLDLAVAQNPDLFIWLGDNIYGDSEVLDTLDAKYRRLASKTEFKRS